MEATPIRCAECRAEIPEGDRVFVLDSTSVGFGHLNTGSAPCAGKDFTVETSDPATLCSKGCTRKRLARL